MDKADCDHEWLVKSSPVIGDTRYRHCKCRLCGDKKIFSVPIQYAPKKKKRDSLQTCEGESSEKAD